MATLYSVGHSTRTFAELVEVLQAHSIAALVDIRAFPMSRRLPHFNRENLEKTLPGHGIAYLWMKELGGYRKQMLKDSPNQGLRNASFRNYADYMLSKEFKAAVCELVRLGESSRTAYMCAERVYFRCHRMLVSDYLLSQGHEVMHIDGTGAAKPHKLTAEAQRVGADLFYKSGELF